MSTQDEWSYLWEHPEEYLLVANSEISQNPDDAMIYDKRSRAYLLIENLGNENLGRLLVHKLREAGAATVESRDFCPDPPDSIKIIEEGRAAGLSREEINRRLKEYGKTLDPRRP